MRIATHDGSFHADEVFAVAALSLLGPIDVVRSRDPDVLAAADLRVDVGFSDDAANGDFDHHQRGFDRVRANGVRYASFGLVWEAYGARVCGGADVADLVDATLVQGVDANDVGQQLTRPLIDGVQSLTVNGIVGGFNLPWDAPGDEAPRFEAAVTLARGILEREIASAAAGLRARRVVEDAITGADDPRIVELPVNGPWKSVLVPAAPEALYVIYPKRQGFGLEAVPRELGSFANRRDLPESWGGLEGADLVAVTGVEDALFCHAKRFLVVAGSRAGIIQLAALALREPDGPTAPSRA